MDHYNLVFYYYADRPAWYQVFSLWFYMIEKHPFFVGMAFYNNMHHLWEFLLTFEQVSIY